MPATTRNRATSRAVPPTRLRPNAALPAQHVREARDRLTSTSGTRPAFDYELLRQFAQNRLSGSLVILLLVVTSGCCRACGPARLTLGDLDRRRADHPPRHHRASAGNSSPSRRRPPISRSWRMRFIMLDLFFGLAWTFILIHPIGADESRAPSCCSSCCWWSRSRACWPRACRSRSWRYLAGHHRDRARLYLQGHAAQLHPGRHGADGAKAISPCLPIGSTRRRWRRSKRARRRTR